jgi:amino acid transporter
MEQTKALPPALALLSGERPRNVGWFSAGALLFGDWGTSRLYVLGLAFLVAGRSSFLLIAAMSLLILAVGWAYTQICRIYQNGGGVYTAGRQRSALVGVVGALLLFADYTVTASLSAVEAFHYFGLGETHDAQIEQHAEPGDQVVRPPEGHDEGRDKLLQLNSPAMWAIVSILVIGAFNLLGPKHTAGYAIFAAVGMVAITLLIVLFALPQVSWSQLQWGRLRHPPADLWYGFVYIVLALSGVEAIANLTGVMRKPVYRTARQSIWLVAVEVAVFNMLLAAVMISLAGQMSREAHAEDMLAFMARQYVPAVLRFEWGEWAVRILGGMLLLSATNTAVNGLMSIVYVMSRDGEMPAVFQRLNGFGAPWVAALLAALVPAGILLMFSDLRTLASLYAIGVVGAVAINCSLTTFHPRLRKVWRKFGMAALAILLVAIWVSLAVTKLHALAFVTVVMAVGLSLRKLTRLASSRRRKPSLLRQAIIDQLTPDALARPRILLATAGSDQMAPAAMRIASAEQATLVVCFVRQVALSYKVEAETRLSLDTDPAAQALFTDFLEYGHRYDVPVIPSYDTGPDAAVLIAELAAINGCDRVLIGTSRRGALHKVIKGSFQRQLEHLLPPDIRVQVLEVTETRSQPAAVSN